MKKIILFLAILIFLATTSVQAGAFTVYDRSAQTVKGETIVFYTIAASVEEAEDFRAMMNKILAEIFYKIYPRESPSFKDNLKMYILQIVIKDGEKTVEYFEFPLPRTIIDQILEENKV
ncbi:MAG: hypothetical protein Q8L57_02650 [bacterium]|nr:hypothetical protein [bacterium]